MDRPVCNVAGCESLCTLQHTGSSGEQVFRSTCWAHGRAVVRRASSRLRSSSEPCERCGWSEAPCDRHRLAPMDGYSEGNVVVLCPNCHREVTFWGEHILGERGYVHD